MGMRKILLNIFMLVVPWQYRRRSPKKYVRAAWKLSIDLNVKLASDS